ncbi:MAG: trypsin-like peptidase domain-containing protein [Bacteroidia bacterium]
MKLKKISFLIICCFALVNSKAQSWSASGVVLSSAGYIATSNHALEAGYHYEIDVFNNGIKKTYQGNLVKADPANDLAILKIDDPLFAVIGAVPYALKVRDVKENEKIFVMSYPTGSGETKTTVTEGIINSKSGYPNDIGSYQLSCVMKPGYEGAPLFDNQGNIVGIINSKLAQSSGYATKASCLQNMIETLPKIPLMPTKTTISGLSMDDKTEALEKFIVAVRVSNQTIVADDNKNKKVVGQTYGGGIIFYVDASGEHGLIASIDNGEGVRAQWGCYNTLVDDTQIGIGTGQENTKKIITVCRAGASSQNIAARLCNELVLEGFTDWYLPSKEELNLLYENKEIIGGYEHGYYWSSSEVDSHFAWYQHFDFGFQDYLNKDFSYFFRPIRSF